MTYIQGLAWAVSTAVAAWATASTFATRAAAAIDHRPETVVQIGVADLSRSARFYTEVLGFAESERPDDLRFAHITTNVPGLELGLNQVESAKGSGSVVINIGVMRVHEARDVLERRGAVFQGRTVVIPGKVALETFTDPDGNGLRLAGPPETVGPG